MVRHRQSCGCLNAMSQGNEDQHRELCGDLLSPNCACSSLCFFIYLERKAVLSIPVSALKLYKRHFFKEYLRPFCEPFISCPNWKRFCFMFYFVNFFLLIFIYYCWVEGKHTSHGVYESQKTSSISCLFPLERWNLNFQQVPSSSVPSLQSLPGGYLAFSSLLICLFLFCGLSLHTLCLYLCHLLLTFFGVNFICCKARKWEPCMGQLGI